MTDENRTDATAPMTPTQFLRACEDTQRRADWCRHEALRRGLNGDYRCDTNFELFFDCLKEVRR